ncbi:MAG: CARDB domain-containing protein, partial [Planctomycetota bacterium]
MARKQRRLSDQPSFAQRQRERRRAKVARLSRRRLSDGLRRSPFERLEDRHLLATIQWDGGGDGTRWHDPLNWVDDTIPGPSDDAVIDDPAELDVTIDLPTEVASIDSSEHLHLVGVELKTSSLIVDELSIDNGTLAPNATGSLSTNVADRLTIETAASQFMILGQLQVSGDLVLGGGFTLVADGSESSLTLDGQANLERTSLSAINGGTLSIPAVESIRFDSSSINQSLRLEARGAGSRIELPGLISLNGGTHFNADVDVIADAGGAIDLSSVVAIIDPVAGDTRRRDIAIRATGSDSSIDLSSLTSIIDRGADERTEFTALAGGTVIAPLLTNAQGTSFVDDASGNLSLEQLVSLVDSRIHVSDRNVTLGALTSASESVFAVSGATLSLPLIESLRDGGIALDGASFDAPSLRNIDGSDLSVGSGATIHLPGITSYRHLGDASSVRRSWNASGAGSRIELPDLASIVGGTGFANEHAIAATGGGIISLPAVEQILDPDQGDLRFRAFQITASESGSEIHLDSLTAIVDRAGADAASVIDASVGGVIVAPALTHLRGVDLTIDTATDVPVANFVDVDDSSILVDGQPSVFASLRSIRRSTLVLNDTDAELNLITRFEHNQLITDFDATVRLPLVTSIDGSGFEAYGGTRIAFPDIESYDMASSENGEQVTWIADGLGSRIDLSGLRSIRGGTGQQNRLTAEASFGGSLDLRDVTQIVDPNEGNASGRGFEFVAEGGGSEIRFDALANIIDRNDDNRSILTSRDGGSITAPSLVTLINTDLSGDSIGEQGESSSDSSGQSSDNDDDGSAFTPAAIQTVSWIAGDGDWADGSNWSSGTVPGRFDAVQLPDANVTVTLAAGDHVIHRINGPGALHLTGGSLTVFGSSTLSGDVNLSGGAALKARGPQAAVLVNGPQAIDGGNLQVLDGAEIRFASVSSYSLAATANNQQRSWLAEGAGSRIVFDALTTIRGGTFFGNRLEIEARAGAQIELPAVTRIEDGVTGNASRRAISVKALDAGSRIDLSSLSVFHDASTSPDDGTSYSQLIARNGATMELDALTSLQGVSVARDALSALSVVGLTTFDEGRLEVIDETVALPSLASAIGTYFIADNASIELTALTTLHDGGLEVRSGGGIQSPSLALIDGSELIAKDGGQLDLPLVASYSHSSTVDSQTRRFVASGNSSRIRLANLTIIEGGSRFRAVHSLEARDGGLIDLPALTQVTEPTSGNREGRAVHFTADGLASQIELPVLAQVTDVGESPVTQNATSGHSSLAATRGGQVNAPSLTSVNGTRLFADETSTIDVAQLESAVDSVVHLIGSTPVEFTSLRTAIGSALRFDGREATFPLLTDLYGGELSVQGGTSATAAVLERIDSVTLIVRDGVTLSLPAVNSIAHATTGNSQRMLFRAEGPGSVLELPNVDQIIGGDHFAAVTRLEAISGGRIHLPNTQEIEERDSGNANQRRIEVLAEGIGSVIHLGQLVSFTDNFAGSLDGADRFSAIESRYGGTIEIATTSFFVPTLTGVHVTVGDEGTISGALNIDQGSILIGSGFVDAFTIIDGLVRPEPELMIGGLVLRETGVIEFEVGGQVPILEHDVLRAGFAELNGTIRLVRVEDHSPQAGDRYAVMTFEDIEGTPLYEGLDFGTQVLSPELSATSLEFTTGFSSGPSVAEITPSDSAAEPDGPFLVIRFDEPIDPSTFDISDVALANPSDVAVAVQSIAPVSGTDDQFLLRPDTTSFVNGSYSITIGPDILDLVGNAMNQDGDMSNGEAVEDEFAGMFNWALPDLRVEGGVVPTVGTEFTFGDDVQLTFDVVNQSVAIAGGSGWSDRVFLSRDTILDAGDLELAHFTRNDVVGPGASYTNTGPITLPLDETYGEGTYYLLVSIDDDSAINEIDDENVFASVELQLSFPPLIDLTPTAIEGPSVGQPRQSSVFTWSVTNQGDLPTSGAWFDHVYLESTADGSRVLAGSVFHFTQTLRPGESYTSMMTTSLPDLEDGDYRVIVTTDASDRFVEGPFESNNDRVGNMITLTHADVSVQNVIAPSSADSGQAITISWDFLNSGSGTAFGWQQRVVISSDELFSADDRVIDAFTASPLGPGQTRAVNREITLPLDFEGNLFVLIVSDAANEVGELPPGEANNVASSPIELTLAPFADLAVSGITAPQRVIGDPALIEVGWTVTNLGTGRGVSDTWTDAIVLSTNDVLGDSDDRIVATFEQTTGLDQNASYSRLETIKLPPGTNNRFHLFVHSDDGDRVFENGRESNNSLEADHTVEVMPAPFADLIVSDIDVPLPVNAGSIAEVSWAVTNQGIGITSRGDWYDLVYLAADQAGTQPIDGTERSFQHFGQVEPGGVYSRTGSLTIPDGLSGDHYFIVHTAIRDAPFEFLFTDNNLAPSVAVPITLLPAPDLVVTDIIAPTEAEEGTLIDVAWTIQNDGVGEANGGWLDRVYLQDAGDIDAPIIELGQYPFTGSVPAGQSYTRREAVRVPVESSGVFRLFVRTNFEDLLYEGSGNGNNTSFEPITVDVKPRADLQVESITIPDRLSAGMTLSPEFIIVNQGSIGTGSRRWVDRVYLSLDPVIDQADILIGELDNGSSLEAGQRYSTEAGSVTIPIRYRGDVYVIVQTDAEDRVEEWPRNDNNITFQSLFIEPEPLADLVVSNVVSPTQVVAGAEVPVRYTVTNLGNGATHGDTWAENVWLTRDRNRPHPGQGDILLETITHTGSLGRLAGYETATSVRIPVNLESGNWFITPWVDPLDVIPEDTLASNENPDDPGNFDNNNYKARAVDVVGAQPDLIVSSLDAPATAVGGDTVTITWTVENIGFADAQPGGWLDRVYLSDHPDPNAEGAKSLLLSEYKREAPLVRGAAYTASIDVPLSPSATGQYVVVITDDELPPTPSIDLTGFFPGLTETDENFSPVAEVDETNNVTAIETHIVANAANLQVVSFDLPQDRRSGEEVTIRYTIENVGDHSIWGGTRYWRDFIWLSADDTFIRNRASYLGSAVHVPEGVIAPGDQYTMEFTATLPEGASGDYSLWVHLDSHNDQSPFLFPFQARVLTENWFPADEGSNAAWLAHFDRWAFEDPSDNLARADFSIVYQEADLQVTDFVIPPGASSGETVEVTYTIENQGDRATRVDAWTDRIFISRDASLDNFDHELASVPRRGTLAPGESYTARTNVRIPDGIEGDVHLAVFADSAAQRDRAQRPSDIGFGLVGLEFETPGSLAPWDLASQAARESARGDVKEYQLEGNNLAIESIPIALTPPPDLQVASIDAPTRADRGQEIAVNYTVTNFGGDSLDGQDEWIDLVYLSRDEFLDLGSDLHLGAFERVAVLGAGESYSESVVVSLPTDLLGAYYVFVITDPERGSLRGDVFEGNQERNNSAASEVPMIIELPPPVDLQITDIDVPDELTTGQTASIQWTVTNTSSEAVSGRWSDTVYFSNDAAWDLTDAAAGRVEFRGTIAPGESYTSTLEAITPSITPGSYRAIVRTDIFNEVYEDVADGNNTTASPSTVTVTAPQLTLDVEFGTTIGSSEDRLFAVDVPADRTLRVTVIAEDDSTHEVFLKHNDAPTVRTFDAGSGGRLSDTPAAIVPTTEAGTYFVLVRGFATESKDSPIRILAELLPLAITDIETDIGGDSSFVTATIRGARFHKDAIVKLVRPGFAELTPVNQHYVSASEIIITLDLEDVPRGLYDLQVINPSGDSAVVPYRFQVERTIEPEVTVGVGGPRFILAGDSGTYSVSLRNLGNVDAPYVFYQVGVPELGVNENVYNLPFASFTSNLRGGPEGSLVDLPWAELDSAVNNDGHVTASGYLFDQPADGFSGFTFQVQTYPGLRELHDHSFAAFRDRIYEAIPEYAALDLLADGPEALDQVSPGLSLVWEAFGAIPDLLIQPLIPLQYHVVASATSMTRDEFLEHTLAEADQLRNGILADETADAALVSLAGDPDAWRSLYLNYLVESGRLRAEDAVPPTRRDQELASLLATLAGGVLTGPGGEQVRLSGEFVDFFESVRRWYGHDPTLEAPVQEDNASFSSDSLSFLGILESPNPVAAIPTFDDYDLGLSSNTHFQSMRVYVPWVPFGNRGAGIPAEYQITGITPNDEDIFFPLNLQDYYEEEGRTGGASQTGPFTLETGGFVPVGEALPVTVHFQNDPGATRDANEIRIVVPLDDEADPRTFRLGDLQIGDLTIRMPPGRSLYQDDLEFAETLGFNVRVSAGVDLQSRSANWLIQAIDPLTGEVRTDIEDGLLPPNNARGQGAGFVSYSIEIDSASETTDTFTASARVLLDNAPPEDAESLSYTIDAIAPVSRTQAASLNDEGDVLVSWEVVDDEGGSGFKHVTLYVAEDGGDFKIWQRQLSEASGESVFAGIAGRDYEFLALASDRAGNRETPPTGASAEDDGSTTSLGTLPSVDATTSPNFGIAATPTSEPSTNPLFVVAEQSVPNRIDTSRPATFDQVLKPFTARQFADGFDVASSGIATSGVGPLAIVETPDGEVLVSGGPSRNQLYRFDADGGTATGVWAELDYPIYNLAFGVEGRLWATTGGGPLLELDPVDGAIVAEYGDGITLGLAIDPIDGSLLVGSRYGVERFDPATQTFDRLSRDQNLRIGSLAFSNDGTLYAVQWPERNAVLRFTELGRAETVLSFDTPIDSIAFGAEDTPLEGLLFVTHNSGDRGFGQSVARDRESELTMVDLATLRRVAVASGGSRGDVATTTRDGRVLVSQSDSIDVLSPIRVPEIVATNPAEQTIIALPLGLISVTFSEDMFVGSGAEPNSVLNPGNYAVRSGSGDHPVVIEVAYHEASRTASLFVEGFSPGEQTLFVGAAIESAGGFTLPAGYEVNFTAVSEFSSNVNIQITDTRLDRAAQALSYEVVITNQGDHDLLLPMSLVLTPEGDVGRAVPGQTSVAMADGAWLFDLADNVPGDVRLSPGESTTAKTLRVLGPDDSSADFVPGFLAAASPNLRPEFTTFPPETIVAGATYEYEARAEDPDGVAIRYLLRDAPDGMTVDASTGMVSWSTSIDVGESQQVELYAIDSRGGLARQRWEITVAGADRAPSFVQPPDSASMNENQTLVLPIQVIDADSANIDIWVENLPPGAFLDPSDNTLYWSPGENAAGVYADVTLVAHDGVNTVRHTFDLTVSDADRPPRITSPPRFTVRQGDVWTYRVDAFDLDQDELLFTSTNLPPGATLDAREGTLRWEVPFHLQGLVAIPIAVSAGGRSTVGEVTLEVLNANGAPSFDPMRGWSIDEGKLLTIITFARDPDNPEFSLSSGDVSPVTYRAVELPEGATFDAATATFEWTPGFDQSGDYEVVFQATDDGDGTDDPVTIESTVPISVRDVNRQPVIEVIANQVFVRGEMVDIPVVALDPDGDAVMLEAVSGFGGISLPDFVTFFDNGNGTGFFHFAPGTGDRGDYTFSLIATDDGNGRGRGAVESVRYDFIVSIESENDPPILEPISSMALAGGPLRLPIQASDLDQESLTYAFVGLPDNARIVAGARYGEALLNWDPTPDDIGTYDVTVTVTDGGNGDAGLSISDSQSFTIQVRDNNQTPALSVPTNVVTSEGQPLIVHFSASDADADTIRFVASGLPADAVLNPLTGQLTWTPSFEDAGSYTFDVTATDGVSSETRPVSITVENVNRSPQLAFPAAQFAREGVSTEFRVTGADFDGGALELVATNVPDGAFFDVTTGVFRWQPGFDQAGRYVVSFTLTDDQNATDSIEVPIVVDNVNRAPQIDAREHQVLVGELLDISIAASDPDADDTLVYSAHGLPEGAEIDATSGRITWIPNPGQLGSLIVDARVSDGLAEAKRNVVIHAVATPTQPSVRIVTTPSFPALPGQTIRVQVIADGLAPIQSLSLNLDAVPLTLDERGRAEFTAGAPGKQSLTATATDGDGFTGRFEQTVRVRESSDRDPPAIAFGAFETRFTTPSDIVATIADTNLDWWELTLAVRGSDDFVSIGRAESNVENASLVTLDPRTIANGFYTLKLTARDIGGRQSVTTRDIEVNTQQKDQAFLRTDVDAEVTVNGKVFSIERQYDSLQRNVQGELGSSWRFTFAETRLQLGVEPDARTVGNRDAFEAIGVYSALSSGDRVYLNLPDGRRAGFTFDPVAVQPFANNDTLLFYRPRWIPDDGIEYQLESVDRLLTRGGTRFYDQASGQPYHPSNRLLGEDAYRLIAPDASTDTLDGDGRIQRREWNDGDVWHFSASGITLSGGEFLPMVTDADGRITSIRLPAHLSPLGDLHYRYDSLGRLIETITSTDASSLHRYGYEQGTAALTVAGGDDPRAYPSGKPLTGDLARVADFAGNETIGEIGAGEQHHYAFTIDEAQLRATDEGVVWVRASVERYRSRFIADTPTILGLDPVARSVGDDRTVALFAISEPGQYLLGVEGGAATDAGRYLVRLDVVGDVDRDGSVDGFDSGLLADVLGSFEGDRRYEPSADFDSDGAITVADTQLLAANFGVTWGFSSQTVSDRFTTAAFPVYIPEPGSGDGPEFDPPVDPSTGSDTRITLPPAPPAGIDPPDLPPESLATIEGATFGIRDGFFEGNGSSWATVGDVAFENGVAKLQETPGVRTSLRQAFFIPDAATTLRFSVSGLSLGADDQRVPDAFEVALVDATTLDPLVAPAQRDSDAFLNLAFDGRYTASTQVIVGDAQAPDPGVDLGGTTSERLLVQLDIDAVPAGTLAILSFDLLGFATASSHVRLDEVFLVGEDLRAPIAQTDLATTDEDVPIVLDVLANDSDSETSIDRNTLSILANPNHGQVIVGATGLVTYSPDPDYSGHDSFSYTVKDSDGYLSNEAFVSIDIAPATDTPALFFTEAFGDQDTEIALNIAVTSGDLDGSESLSIKIDSLPQGATLTSGTRTADGSYDLTAEQLIGLRLIPSAGWSGQALIDIRATAEDDGDDPVEVTGAMLLDVAASIVEPISLRGFEVNRGETQRSSLHTLAVTFNQDAWIVDPSADILIVSDDGEDTRIDPARFSYDDDTFTLTIDVEGLITRDDQYYLALRAAGIASDSNRLQTMANGPEYGSEFVPLPFHRLLADVNGNNQVDVADWQDIRESLNSRSDQPRYVAYRDLTGEGIIDRHDFVAWRNQLGDTTDDQPPQVLGTVTLPGNQLPLANTFQTEAVFVVVADDVSAITSLTASINGSAAIELGDHRIEFDERNPQRLVDRQPIRELDRGRAVDGCGERRDGTDIVR